MEKRIILKSQKHVFWEALVIAVFIFGLGILLGVFLENARAEKISEAYLKSEVDLLDIKIQTELLDVENLNCDEAIEKNIEFGDRIYEEAKTLKDYEDASRLTEELREQHKRYDLLRTLFWINSIKIKEKCGENFHTVIYLYNHDPENLEETSEQGIFSRFLSELKQEKGSEIVLIPIAKNMGLSSLELMISNYDLGRTSIILDEKLVISDLDKLEDIRQALN